MYWARAFTFTITFKHVPCVVTHAKSILSKSYAFFSKLMQKIVYTENRIHRCRCLSLPFRYQFPGLNPIPLPSPSPCFFAIQRKDIGVGSWECTHSSCTRRAFGSIRKMRKSRWSRKWRLSYSDVVIQQRDKNIRNRY